MPSTSHFPPTVRAETVRRGLTALTVGVALAAGVFSAAALFVGGLPVAGFVVTAATFTAFVFAQPHTTGSVERPGPAAELNVTAGPTRRPLADVDRTLTSLPAILARPAPIMSPGVKPARPRPIRVPAAHDVAQLHTGGAR